MAKAGVTMKYHKVHKVLGEGNFVLVASEGEFAGRPSAFYDLFRVENGKIAASVRRARLDEGWRVRTFAFRDDASSAPRG
jgi:hypothetical protein